MSATLVLLETTSTNLRSSSLPAVSAARELAKHHGGPVVGVVIGAGVATAASDAARFVDQVLCYVNFGYLPQEAVLESITLLGDYVIPELKAMGAKRTARNLETSIAMQQAAE